MTAPRDYFGEILALHGSGNIEALAKLALELANRDAVAAELERREIERKAQRKRQKQAERERRRMLSRDSERRETTDTPVARQEATSLSVAEVERHSPLPIPSSSFPGPHLTTPLTPLPSAPPPPARAREARPDDDPERHQIAHLEFTLANRLVSDADRNALTALVARVPAPTTWLAEMLASLDGMAGHVHVTPEQLGQALRDYSGNGAMASPGLKHFRIYLRKASAPEPAHAPSDDFDTAVTKHASRGDRRALEAEAGEMLATIRGLVRTHDLHGQGRKEYVPKSEVEKLGPRAMRAYESVGGADRVLTAKGDDISYLIRDFTNAYVHASATPALAGGAA